MTAIEALTDAKKEQIKLRATFLNNIGVGIMLIGVFTPVVRTVYGEVGISNTNLILVTISPFACFCLGTALHFLAARQLRELSHDS
jgi:hypothetical protein